MFYGFSWSFILSVLALAGALSLVHPGNPQAASKTCSRLSTQNGRDFLQNNCNSCQIVNIQRKRPGSGAPISRVVTIPAKSKVGLSFKGPGRSRIMSENACNAKAGSGTRNSIISDGLKCIGLKQTSKGLALINRCSQCRVAVVERRSNSGNRKMQTLAVGGRGAINLPAKGAAYAKILSEKSCK